MNIAFNKSDWSTRIKALLLTVVMLASVMTFAAPVQAATTTDVVLEPNNVSLAPGDTATVDVVVTNTDGGVGTIRGAVTSSNTNVIRVVDASVAGNPQFDDTSTTDSEASIRAAVMDTTDTGRVAVVTVTIEAVSEGTADLGLTVNELGDENADPYTVSSTSGTTVEVNEGTLSTQVQLSPSTTEVTAGSTTTFDIVVDSANGGVGAIDATISVSDLNVAEITDATAAGNPQGGSIDVATDGSTVRIQGFGMDTADTGTVTVGTVTVSGAAAGTTDLGLTVNALSTEPGESYAISNSPGATLEVTEGGGTPGDETTVTVALDGAPNGLQRYSVNVSATNGASISSVEPVLISGRTFQVEDGGPSDTYVVVRGVDFAGTVGAFQDQRTLVEVTFDGDVSEEDIELTVGDLTNDDGNEMDPNRVTFSVGGQSPFTSPIPGTGAENPPQDTDDDGLYEDVDGNGDANFDDAVALAFVQTDQLTQEQIAALDFDGDGDVDFDDAFELAFSV